MCNVSLAFAEESELSQCYTQGCSVLLHFIGLMGSSIKHIRKDLGGLTCMKQRGKTLQSATPKCRSKDSMCKLNATTKPGSGQVLNQMYVKYLIHFDNVFLIFKFPLFLSFFMKPKFIVKH